MKTIDLTAIRVVEKRLKGQLEPFIATQQRVQEVIDSQRPILRTTATAIQDFVDVVEKAKKVVGPSTALLDAYVKMQELTEKTSAMFELPGMMPVEPVEFGEMCVEVMEYEVETPVATPEIRMAEKDRKLIIEGIVKGLIAEGYELNGQRKRLKPLSGLVVKQLVMVRPEGRDRMKIVVNADYSDPVEVGGAKCWNELLLICEGAKLFAEKSKHTLDYLNTNKDCALYTKSKYQMTRILGVERGMIVPLVEVEVITEKAFATRRNKAT